MSRARTWLQRIPVRFDPLNITRVRNLRVSVRLSASHLRDDRKGRLPSCSDAATTSRSRWVLSLQRARWNTDPAVDQRWSFMQVAADASIIRVFLAGIMPGLLLIALFSG